MSSPGTAPARSAQSPADVIPARMLNEFVYCPRLFYYEFVEGLFAHNADTLAGKAAHKRVDSGKGDLPPAKSADNADGKNEEPKDAEVNGKTQKSDTDDKPEIIHSRSVSLTSERLGVTAKMDLIEVEVERNGDRDLFTPLRVCPVDYKVGAPRETDDGKELWDSDKIQLGLQILILRDNGYTCTEGVIYYRSTRQRVRLRMTPDLEGWIREQIASARATVAGPIPDPLADSPKCPRCSLASICLPDETRLLTESPAYPDDEDLPLAEQAAFPFDRDFPAPRHPALSYAQEFALKNGRLPAIRPARRLIAANDDKRVLYLNTPGAYVGKTSERLVVKEKKEKILEVRINDLHHVALFGSVGMSTPAIQTLCEKDIPITWFSMGGWFYGMTRGHSLKNVFTRIEQFRAADDPTISLRLAQAFVHGKIRNQRTLLMRNHIETPHIVRQRLKYAARSCFDTSSLEELLGIEGAAALAYFENFAGMIKTGRDPAETDSESQTTFSFDFTRRNRRPPKDAVNALLSLGYSLLARDCTLAAYAVGFDPYIGFYHQPRFGRPALALDLMEEFRPVIVDSVVLTMLNNRIITPKDFIQAGDAVNLTSSGRKLFFEQYERRLNTTVTHPVFDYKVSYRRAIELQVRLLAKALTGEIESYLPFMNR